jgi:hypothetical protein
MSCLAGIFLEREPWFEIRFILDYFSGGGGGGNLYAYRRCRLLIELIR